MADFFHRHKYKIILAALVFGAVYLAIHFLIFDKEFKYDGLGNFILEGREHILHVAPVIIVFLWLLVLSIRDRIREKRNENTPNDDNPQSHS